jgi:uncharacterized protein (TIGR03437 family)
MKHIRVASALLLLSGAALAPLPAQTLGGCAMFPANNIWNTPIDTLPVSSFSAAYINSIGPSTGLHPDFGSGTWDGEPIGIPYALVPGSQPKVAVTFDYADQSDPGPYPIPANPPIEGGADSTGDRHILLADSTNCILYELYAAYPQPDGTWQAGSGAIFDLKGNQLRPQGWTSADAAGLPILPGLVRYDEILAGKIAHAIRFTVQTTQKAYLWPARHYASSNTSTSVPPMGARFRLKSSFDVSGFPPEVQIILNAMRKYGVIVADNGSNWYVSGVPDDRWNNDNLATLHNVQGSDFEAVDESGLMLDPNSAQANLPPGYALLSVALTHSGNFVQGQAGATYSVVVSDASGAAPTSGAVTVTETLPTGLTLVSMAGSGWSCSTSACSRTDALNAGSSYSPIVVTVNVAPDAPAQVLNQVALSGGAAWSAGASDLTGISSAPGACTYTVTPSSLTAAYSGGSLIANIQTGAACAWAVQNLPAWIAVSGSAQGAGAAAVTLVVAANSGPPRTAQISIADVAVSVNQSSNLLLVGSGGVVNAASYTTPVAPGSLAAVFGNFLLASPIPVTAFPIPTNLGGLSLQFASAPSAPLFFANSSQVNAQVPWELAGQSQPTVIAGMNGQTSAPQTASLAAYAPGIFTVNGAGSGPGAILDLNFHLISASNPTTAGAFIQIYCTGLGPVSNQPATGGPSPLSPLASTPTWPIVTIGGAPATVQFSGLTPGYVGLYQVNAQVPSAAPKGAAVPLSISIGGATSNTVTIAVQ